MRVRSKTIFARIGDGGELNLSALAPFLKLHRGSSVIVKVDVAPLEPTERMTNFFFGYVVKEMRLAYDSLGSDYTEEQTYDQIRANCPVFFEEIRENGEWKRKEKEWEDLDTAEAVEAIAWIQRWAATEFQWIIDDPR